MQTTNPDVASKFLEGAPNNFQVNILRSLQGMSIYAGTADPVEVKRRRAANKRARKSRMINRRKKK